MKTRGIASVLVVFFLLSLCLPFSVFASDAPALPVATNVVLSPPSDWPAGSTYQLAPMFVDDRNEFLSSGVLAGSAYAEYTPVSDCMNIEAFYDDSVAVGYTANFGVTVEMPGLDPSTTDVVVIQYLPYAFYTIPYTPIQPIVTAGALSFTAPVVRRAPEDVGSDSDYHYFVMAKSNAVEPPPEPVPPEPDPTPAPVVYMPTASWNQERSTVPEGYRLSVTKESDVQINAVLQAAIGAGLQGELVEVLDIKLVDLQENPMPSDPAVAAATVIAINVPGLTPRDRVTVVHQLPSGDFEFYEANSHTDYFDFVPTSLSSFGFVVEKNVRPPSEVGEGGGTGGGGGSTQPVTGRTTRLSPQTGVYV